MKNDQTTEERAIENYSDSSAWPKDDPWHNQTYNQIFKLVTYNLQRYCDKNALILNAGSGGTLYGDYPNMIHMDIVETNIAQFPNHIVGSVSDIPLQDESIDVVI